MASSCHVSHTISVLWQYMHDAPLWNVLLTAIGLFSLVFALLFVIAAFLSQPALAMFTPRYLGWYLLPFRRLSWRFHNCLGDAGPRNRRQVQPMCVTAAERQPSDDEMGIVAASRRSDAYLIQMFSGASKPMTRTAFACPIAMPRALSLRYLSGV